MNEIEYVFGTGDGTRHIWTGVADVELATPGVFDAIQLDFDGDGIADDVLWDSGGTGIADVAALDLDDDGVLDHFFTDPNGSGVWDHQITGSYADAESERLNWIVRAGVEPPEGSSAPDVSPPDSAMPQQVTSEAEPGSQGDLPDYLANVQGRDGRIEHAVRVPLGVEVHGLSDRSGPDRFTSAVDRDDDHACQVNGGAGQHHGQ